MTISGASFKDDIPQRTVVPFGTAECVVRSAQKPSPKPKLLD